MTKINQRVHVQGIVQGVGFRPTVFLLAQKHHLTGWVLNSANGVEIEIHGEPNNCQAFILDLQNNPPPLANVDFFEAQSAPLQEFKEFEILESRDRSTDFLPVSPDLAICSQCMHELFDPSDRRFRYPFINCTNCGPRFSIVTAVPYDRPNTSMSSFKLCPDCSAEYHDPTNRRFHAQPVACPVCGPSVWFELNNNRLAQEENAIRVARQSIKDGKIIAVKGLGGFHLACDAQNRSAVQKLRERKHRSNKAFAMMAFDLAVVEKYIELTEIETTLLTSSQAPIVLGQTTSLGRELLANVAPDTASLGFMLPYTPLHALLLEPEDDYPEVLIMTSGNLSEEPIAFKDQEGRERLSPLADGFLMHDRPIFMRVDDSVMTTLENKPYLFRRARGFAPSPLQLPGLSLSMLAAGTHLKNTFCLSREKYAFVSHFIGDLENQETLTAYEQAIRHYESVFRITPELIACDLHPDYLATRYAKNRSSAEELPLVSVQHHHAHIAACLAENKWDSTEPVIGLAFDGTGYGSDGTVWGGEVLIADYKGFERRFHLASVSLPGGDISIHKPARMAVSYLVSAKFDIEDESLFPISFLGRQEVAIIQNQIQSGFNSILTSSMGRLFDAVSSLLNLYHVTTYEAQASIALEAITDSSETGYYDLPLEKDNILWLPLMEQLVHDLKNKVKPSIIASRFHNSLIKMSLEVCRQIRMETGIDQVAISGGVWQNMFLMRRILPLLKREGFKPLYHTTLPPNDSCVSLGQIMVALHS